MGKDYPAGLLVVQDGSNEPAVVFPDPEDGEIQNFNTNFKFVSLADFADIFPHLPQYDPSAFDPRNPQRRTFNPKEDRESSEDFSPVFGTIEDDTLDLTGGKNLVFAGEGNDTVTISGGNNRIYGSGGDDTFFLGTGDYVVGGEGADRFWIADGEFPTVANRIADFELNGDVIGFKNLGISFDDLAFTQDGDNTLIVVENRNVAILAGVNGDTLTSERFIFE